MCEELLTIDINLLNAAAARIIDISMMVLVILYLTIAILLLQIFKFFK